MARISKSVRRARRLEKLVQSGQWDTAIAQLKARPGFVLEVDAAQNWKIVSVLFEMDVSTNAPCEYYTADELEAIRKEQS